MVASTDPGPSWSELVARLVERARGTPDPGLDAELEAAVARPGRLAQLRDRFELDAIQTAIIAALAHGPFDPASLFGDVRRRLAALVALDLVDDLRVADRVLEFLAGATLPGPPTTPPLLDEPALIDRVARALAIPDQVVELVGPRGSGRRSIAAAAARQLGKPVLVTDPHAPLAAQLRDARLHEAVLVVDGAAEPAELRRARGPLVVVAERSPAWLAALGRVPIRFEVAAPTAEIQRELWTRFLPTGLRLEPALDEVMRRFPMTGGGIAAACDELARLDAVYRRGGVVTVAHLAAVVRGRLAHDLDALAEPVRTELEWTDAILPDDVVARVFELLDYATHKDAILRDWGFARRVGAGLSALFAGPPGTGKSMVCALIAKELGVELYRVDVARVVDRFLGETEKNLGRVFDEAARGRVMLVFDQADALFARRTEVKSSHDRWANLGIGYLLQRLESHDGLVVLVTGNEAAIDPGFRRRLRFRIRFRMPDEPQRVQLWQGLMPAQAKVGHDVDYRVLAQRFPLSGGGIVNALVRAATAARAEGGPIRQQHLLRAAELELAEIVE
jgi:hypothetical protein